MDLKVVHVGAIGMDVGSDGMSGTMNEIVAVPCLLNVAAGRAIDLPAGNAAPGIDGVQHRLYAGIPSGTPVAFNNFSFTGDGTGVVLTAPVLPLWSFTST